MLVVDDERPVLQTLGAMLTSVGYKVVCVPSGEGALAAARLTAFDGALIDIYMPEMNGFETAIKLREQSAKRGRTILLWHMTGMNNPEVEIRSADCHVVGLLHKPFNLAVLCRTLEAGFDATAPSGDATPPLDPGLTTDTPAADSPVP